MNTYLGRIAIVSSHGRSLIDFRGSLIRELSARGFQVFALAPSIDLQTREQLLAWGASPIEIRMNRAGINPLNDLFSLLSIYNNLRRIRPDFVLSYFIKPVLYGTLAAWLAKVPRRTAMIEGLGYVFTYPTQELSVKGRFIKFVVSWLYRISLKLANKVVFLNPDDCDEFVSLGLANRSKSICIGGIGIDLEKWARAGLPQNSISFLMVARLLREKGVFEYAQAARLVKAKYPHIKFVLLGGLDANPGSINLEQVSDWHEQGVLTWHGHVPVAEHMKATSVYVLPSYREGVPVSTMEAMAMGRPILTTDVPGCRETVVNGVNGFMVPPKDADALAQKMIWFIENPDSIASMGAASRKMAEEKFDVNVINAKLIGIMLGNDREKTI